MLEVTNRNGGNLLRTEGPEIYKQVQDLTIIHIIFYLGIFVVNECQLIEKIKQFILNNNFPFN